MKICSVCSKCFEDGSEVCVAAEHGELKERPHALDLIPGYVIECVIASTPKAVVYHAQQIEYGQVCVISVAEADTTQFLAQAKIAAGLFHACVAGVVESGELPDGSCFAVFEGYTGESLREILADGPLSLLDQIRIARQTAEAVHAIHAAGLFHGALRPENISISGVGSDELSVKIHNIDLGSAFANAILSNRFSMDSSLDSLKYFAPERFRGEAATAQSDVYNLGILLYELLSGHSPFEALSAAALADLHLNQKPPEIKIENFDLRMLLTHTISEALQKQPSFRQSTADLFARQMRHIEQLATHVSTPPPAVAIAMAAASTNRSSSAPQSPRDMNLTNAVPSRGVSRPALIAQPRPIETDAVDPVTVAEPARTLEFQLVSVEPVPDPPMPVVEPAKTLEVEPVKTEPAEAAPVMVAEPVRSLAVQPIKVESPMPFVHVSRRSRLKGIKKRAHSYLSDVRTALSPTPTLIQWEQPEDDVPSIEAVREELAGSGEIAAFSAEEEGIQVRPPADRIGVNWTEPTAARPSSLAVEFVPTLISDPGKRRDEPAVFGYRPHGRDLGKLPIYGVALFAVLIVGLGMVRLGTALAEDSDGYIGEVRPARTETPAAPMRPPVEPEVSVMNIAAEPVSIPASQVSIPAAADTSSEETAVTKEKVVERTQPKSPKRVDSAETKSAAIPVKQASRSEAPVVPSTLVITRGPGKPRTVIVAGDQARESRRVKSAPGATRPRIVSLPN